MVGESGSTRKHLTGNEFVRFLLIPFAVVACFMVLVLCLRLLFALNNWPNIAAAGSASVLKALLKGLRFDLSVVCVILAPAMFMYFLLPVVRGRLLRRLLVGYLVIMALLVPIIGVADLQYFEESGKHMTYEAWTYLGPECLPMVFGAFFLHPWMCAFGLVACAGLGVGTCWLFRKLLSVAVPADGQRRPGWLLVFPVFLTMCFFGGRGHIGGRTLRIGESLISPNPYINALCVSSAYTVFRTAANSATQYSFYTEKQNLGVTRRILDLEETPPVSEDYPLLRQSKGTPTGNRKNIVLFILESWSAKDLGCLGTEKSVTPFFDDLATKGMLFTNFYGNGIRTSEGIFTIMCSFPNQPAKPILRRGIAYQTQWRPISQILADAGYYNIFIHGRDLKFDQMEQFLQYSGQFHKIIDWNDFPPSVSPIDDSWPGYADEDVVRRADEEFTAVSGRPFFGAIYTMNTHPPFITPEGYPLVCEPTTPENRFLNALNYSDYTLKVFFELARTRPWFKDTIFILTADHAATRAHFNLSNQNHIPLLIYSPGYIEPSVQAVVSSQLDVLPTILAMLNLKSWHASWGRNLFEVPVGQGVAPCIVGDEIRWHAPGTLVADSRAATHPLFFDLQADPTCVNDLWQTNQQEALGYRKTMRSFFSLSQTLLVQNRIFPVAKSELPEVVPVLTRSTADGK